MSEILSELDGVVCLVDDVLVCGKTQEEHDQWLKAVLRCLSEAGLTLSREKCEFNKRRIKFPEQLVDETGVQTKYMQSKQWSHQVTSVNCDDS